MITVEEKKEKDSWIETTETTWTDKITETIDNRKENVDQTIQ